MRGRLIVVLAVLAVAAAAAAAYVARPYFDVRQNNPPASTAPNANIAATNPNIKSGFVGMETFGAWRLICISEPEGGEAAAPANAAVDPKAPTPSAANACRVNQEVKTPDNAAQVLLAVNVSLAGPMLRPAIMLRLPPTAKPGDLIVAHFADDEGVRIPVRDCSAAECLALADLTDAEWKMLTESKTLQIAFPAPDGQRVEIDVPMAGLAAAAAAMKTARGAKAPGAP